LIKTENGKLKKLYLLRWRVQWPAINNVCRVAVLFPLMTLISNGFLSLLQQPLACCH